MERKFSEEDSLRVISEMINTARGNLEKGAGKYFLLWGYVVFISSIVHFAALQQAMDEGIRISEYVWTIADCIGIGMTIIFVIRDWGKIKVKTYTGSVINSIWIGFGVAAFTISILLSGKYGAFIYPAINFLYAYALLISASAYKLRWMFLSVVICFFCALSYKFIPFSYYPLSMAIALLSGNIVPGHILNYKAEKNV